MRLEIGAGAAAGRAGGVLWSSAILAAISPRGAAFTSPLPAPAPPLSPPLPPPASARSARPRGPAACGPAARAARASRSSSSSSEPLLVPSSSVLCQPGPLGRACWLQSPLTWTPFSPRYPGLSLGHRLRTACVPFCLSFPL